MSETVTVKDALPFRCPCCDLKAWASMDPPSLGHEEPACALFLAMEPDEYLHLVNQHLRLWQ
jgi:hypothetical protein